MELVGRRPERRILIYFLSAILCGAVLLSLPVSAAEEPIAFIDALFTSTSAVCVTGLIVLDTGKDFSLIGQIIILFLIQIGGLGIMTFASILLARLIPHLSFLDNLALTKSLGSSKQIQVKILLKAVILTTAIFEFLGAILIFLRFKSQFPLGEAIFNSIFHSVSAFCNAGFSTFSTSLEAYHNDIFIILIFSVLIICGGLGFLVLAEIGMRIKTGAYKLSLHSKLSLSATAFLLLLGTLAILFFESGHAFEQTGTAQSVANAFFQSVTARTAGFNTIPQPGLSEISLLLTMILMFIGGCPGSTAGGIKTTTFAALGLLAYNRLKGRTHVRAYNRSISNDSVNSAITVTLTAITLVVIMLVALMTLQEEPDMHGLAHGWFISNAFEVISAFGTVGLSLGTTNQLETGGKIIITILMFLGRVGLLTLVFSLAGPSRHREAVYLEEQIMIG
ncbi:MAG TPA: hypothetical protein ENO22_03420 [candidate division Zixibacteria bacterium]|nr:hypothetical protein [candidate division Zixibacteria bacterium]